eukprot:SM007792S22568  [mRNA]  locus=s7792:2:620:- [translate_table: standard]
MVAAGCGGCRAAAPGARGTLPPPWPPMPASSTSRWALAASPSPRASSARRPWGRPPRLHACWRLRPLSCWERSGSYARRWHAMRRCRRGGSSTTSAL